MQALGAGYYVSTAGKIVVFAIAATSLNLVLGYGGMVSFGHAAFFGLGAYATGVLVSEGVLNGGAHLLATVALTAFAALVIGAISLRTRGVYFIMITLAFGQMLFYLANSIKGYGGDEGLNIRARSLLGFGLDLKDAPTFYYVALAVLAATLARPARASCARASAGRSSPSATTTCAPRRSASPTYRMRLAVFVAAGAIAGHRRRALGQPAGLRQPEPAALDAVGHADGDGDPRRRRLALGRRARRRRAGGAAGGALGLHHRTGSSGPAGCCSRWCCSRATGSPAGWRGLAARKR